MNANRRNCRAVPILPRGSRSTRWTVGLSTKRREAGRDDGVGVEIRFCCFRSHGPSVWLVDWVWHLVA